MVRRMGEWRPGVSTARRGRFSLPILLGEAGVPTAGAGRHDMPNRMRVPAEGGFGGL
jgi:hypothetical protein